MWSEEGGGAATPRAGRHRHAGSVGRPPRRPAHESHARRRTPELGSHRDRGTRMASVTVAASIGTSRRTPHVGDVRRTRGPARHPRLDVPDGDAVSSRAIAAGATAVTAMTELFRRDRVAGYTTRSATSGGSRRGSPRWTRRRRKAVPGGRSSSRRWSTCTAVSACVRGDRSSPSKHPAPCGKRRGPAQKSRPSAVSRSDSPERSSRKCPSSTVHTSVGDCRTRRSLGPPR